MHISIGGAFQHARPLSANFRYSGQLLRHAENVLDAVLPAVRKDAENTNGIPPVQPLFIRTAQYIMLLLMTHLYEHMIGAKKSHL